MGKQMQIKGVDFSANGFRDPLHTTYSGLVLQALEDGEVGFDSLSSIDTPQYSFDGIHWESYDMDSGIILAEGDEVALRVNRSGKMTMDMVYNGDETILYTSCRCRCYGSIETFVAMGPWAYADLFSSTLVVNTPELPAMRLEEGCYSGLFYSCNEMTEAPVLMAPALAPHCYEYMFSYAPLRSLEIRAHGSVYRYTDEFGEGSAVSYILMDNDEEGVLKIPRDLDFPDYEVPTRWQIEYIE